MAESSGSCELYLKYRPTSLKQVVGQGTAVAVLADKLKKKDLPHCLLLTGPSGCGKSTIAHILKKELGCGDMDFRKIDCADSASLETVRELRRQMRLLPLDGKVRICLLEEAQAMSRAPFAQQAMLDMLENYPAHSYFILATTDPSKLIRAIITRCTQVQLASLSLSDLTSLVTSVLKKEAKTLSEDVVDRIVESSEGSARMALVLLHQVVGLSSEEEQLEAVALGGSRGKGIELARALMNPRSRWPDVAPILKDLDEEPEAVRRLVLGYSLNVLLGGGKLCERAYLVISALEGGVLDSGRAGLATLARGCYEVVAKK